MSNNGVVASLRWLAKRGGDGVELWAFPHTAELPGLLAKGLASVGQSATDERIRVRLTDKGRRLLDEDQAQHSAA